MSRHSRVFALFTALFTLSLTGTGCQTANTRTAPETKPAPNTEVSSDTWQKNASGFETLAIIDKNTEPIGIMYAFDPEQFQFAFDTASSGKSIVEWMGYATSAIAVINGVYFHDDDSPSGLLVTDGTEVSTRRFSADKSSVTRLAPMPNILDSNEIAVALLAQEAAQSYPLLLHNRKPQVTGDTGNKAQRSFIGVRDDGHIVLGVTMKKELSLFELSQLLAAKDYRLVSALNLDGGSSSGLYSRDEQVRSYNSLFPVPNVITVQKRSD